MGVHKRDVSRREMGVIAGQKSQGIGIAVCFSEIGYLQKRLEYMNYDSQIPGL